MKRGVYSGKKGLIRGAETRCFGGFLVVQLVVWRCIKGTIRKLHPCECIFVSTTSKIETGSHGSWPLSSEISKFSGRMLPSSSSIIMKNEAIIIGGLKLFTWLSVGGCWWWIWFPLERIPLLLAWVRKFEFWIRDLEVRWWRAGNHTN